MGPEKPKLSRVSLRDLVHASEKPFIMKMMIKVSLGMYEPLLEKLFRKNGFSDNIKMCSRETFEKNGFSGRV